MYRVGGSNSILRPYERRLFSTNPRHSWCDLRESNPCSSEPQSDDVTNPSQATEEEVGFEPTEPKVLRFSRPVQ
jgi:hypothetical protein